MQISKVLENDPAIYLLISKAVAPFPHPHPHPYPFSFFLSLFLLCCPTFCLSAQAQAFVFSDDLSERSKEALFNEQVGCGTICPHVTYSSLQVWLLKGVS